MQTPISKSIPSTFSPISIRPTPTRRSTNPHEVLCLFKSGPLPPSPLTPPLTTTPLVDTFSNGTLPAPCCPTTPAVAAPAGRLTVNGRNCPRFPSGLTAPAGAPIRLAWSSCGFTTPPGPAGALPPTAAAPAPAGLPGPLPMATPPPSAAASPSSPSPSPLTKAATCLPLLASGLLAEWSTPGVRGMEGLCRWGLKAWPGLGAVSLAALGLRWLLLLGSRTESGVSTALKVRAEKKEGASPPPPIAKAGCGGVRWGWFWLWFWSTVDRVAGRFWTNCCGGRAVGGPRSWPPAPGKLLALGRGACCAGVCGGCRGGLPADVARANCLVGGCMWLVASFAWLLLLLDTFDWFDSVSFEFGSAISSGWPSSEMLKSASSSSADCECEPKELTSGYPYRRENNQKILLLALS